MKVSQIEHFDQKVHSCYAPHPKPTNDSIEKINDHFGIQLPGALIEFARHSNSFSSWFASIGPDFDSHTHIIRINSFWRRRRKTRRIPTDLVIINLGHDEDCDCLDVSSYDPESGEYEIQYWCPEVSNGKRWQDFHTYIADLCSK